jgi:hypothetical protein
MKFQELLNEVAKKKPDKKKKPEKKPAKAKVKKAVKKDKFDPAAEPGDWQGKDKSAKTEFESSLKEDVSFKMHDPIEVSGREGIFEKYLANGMAKVSLRHGAPGTGSVGVYHTVPVKNIRKRKKST